ncbi:Pepco domain-containing protein [Mastigocladopsis repens]|uniref:Pepco domain-containing protein n=1 Tax=Mastigocladopsis repens TaxID=221287 RepID=UPI00031CBE40|nr:hypothetical protein [Mastigocladopsis repens]
MSQEISTPEKIWIIVEETSQTETTTGSRSGHDIGGRLGETTREVERTEEAVNTKHRAVEVTKLKEEMQGFLQAMKEILDEADQPSSKMQLDEVQLSVEINGEGKVSLFGVGGKAGGKGAMTFKFKRK